MLDFVIAIPSYHRSESIKDYTLKTLDRHEIPHNLIKVFVSKEEVQTYRKSLPEDIEVIESVVGCIENRAKIRDYYPKGKDIVYMDDDIKGIDSVCDMTEEHSTCHIFKRENHQKDFYKKDIPIPNLMKFLRDAFVIMRKEGAYLAGVYPISNGFMASHKYTVGLKYICGAFYMEINRKDFALRAEQFSEDFERTCAFYKRDGKVIRFDYCMVDTGFYKGKGGLVETRTVELTKLAQEKLQQMYPEFLKIVPPTKSNKYWNLKIIKQKTA